MAANPRYLRTADDEDEDASSAADDADQGIEIDPDEGMRHARQTNRTRAPRQYADDGEDADSDQVIPDRVVRLTLPKPWAHLRIWAWLDYPEEVARLFSPKRADETDEEAGERVMEGMRTVITRHDSWRDREGLLPQPTSRAFWARISTPLARAITDSFFSAMRRNPTPPASRSRKPRS